MKGVLRSIALIALVGSFVGVTAGYASAKSAAGCPQFASLAGSAAPSSCGLPCTTTITRASTGERTSVLACAFSPEQTTRTEKRPLLHAGKALIESEPGVYIVPPHAASEAARTPKAATRAARRAVMFGY